jgi:hypothetical protein
MVKGVWKGGRGLITHSQNLVEREKQMAQAAANSARTEWIFREKERLDREEALGKVGPITLIDPLDGWVSKFRKMIARGFL